MADKVVLRRARNKPLPDAELRAKDQAAPLRL